MPRAFFAGILPEEELRKRIAAILGVSERNDFAMLEQIGGECTGAVSLLPEGVAPPAAGETRLRELSDGELQKLKQKPKQKILHLRISEHSAFVIIDIKMSRGKGNEHSVF